MTTGDFFQETTGQSKVKAAIVSDYFYAWAKVILSGSKHTDRIAYIDLFAGRGRYEDGTKSTPLLVLDKAVQDDAIRKSLITIFNDMNSENVRLLETEIQNLHGIGTLAHVPQVRNHVVGDQIAAMFRQMKLIPTLLFLDPWGYKGLSLELMNSVVKDWACECVFFFNYNRINPGLGNPMVERHMNDLFGKTRADNLRTRLGNLQPAERERAILDEMSEALKQIYGRYVLTFRFMNDEGTRTSHYLVFVTKHFRGYEIMKDIMARKSPGDQGVPSFQYNPIEIRQMRLFELSHPVDALAIMLLDEFAGRTLIMRQVYEEHNVGTPYIKKNYKEALMQLEAGGKIHAEPHRKGSFGDNVRVTFPSKGGR